MMPHGVHLLHLRQLPYVVLSITKNIAAFSSGTFHLMHHDMAGRPLKDLSEDSLHVQQEKRRNVKIEAEEVAQPRQTRMAAREIWSHRTHKSHKALKKKAFLGRVTERAGLTDCCNLVSDKYTITGFEDVDTDFIIELNGELLLSLQPEVFGGLIGMEFDGIPVPQRLNKYEMREMWHSIDRKQRLLAQREAQRNGVVGMRYLKPTLLPYIYKRHKELFLDREKRLIARTYIYCLTREIVFRERYNWAAHKIELLRASLQRQNQFNIAHKAMLRKYFDAVLLQRVKFAAACKEDVREAEGGGGEKRGRNTDRTHGTGETYSAEQHSDSETEELGNFQIQMPRRSNRLRNSYKKQGTGDWSEEQQLSEATEESLGNVQVLRRSKRGRVEAKSEASLLFSDALEIVSSKQQTAKGWLGQEDLTGRFWAVMRKVKEIFV